MPLQLQGIDFLTQVTWHFVKYAKYRKAIDMNITMFIKRTIFTNLCRLSCVYEKTVKSATSSVYSRDRTGTDIKIIMFR
jgi:hypothetical protein